MIDELCSLHPPSVPRHTFIQETNYGKYLLSNNCFEYSSTVNNAILPTGMNHSR